jgi:hypothetical protein
VTSFITVSCARWFLSLWIVHSSLHLRVSLTFSYLKFLLINKCMTIQHIHICYKLKVSMELQMFWKHSNTSLTDKISQQPENCENKITFRRNVYLL